VYGSTSRKIKIYFLFFALVFVGVFTIYSSAYSACKPEALFWWNSYDLPVEYLLKAVVAEGRQEVEDCRHSVGYSVDDNAEPFLLWIWRSVPG